jgi:hypothetical protein
LGSKRLNPLFDQRRAATETRLANQGIYKGSEAYDREFSNFGQQENDAYNQLLLTGRGQAVQEALTERNQPINEITALMSGGQVSQPNFTNTPTASVGAPDVAGLTMDAYKYGPLAQYTQQSADRRGMIDGLFKLGGAVGGGLAMSDARLKENVRRVGTLDNGLPVYVYNYKGNSTPQIGLIAQDVEKVNPEAVAMVGGYRAVYYAKAVL